jgi:protein-disulfide isomerase
MAGNALGAVVGSLVVGALIGVGGTLAVNNSGKGTFGSGGTSKDGSCSLDGAGTGNSELFKIDGNPYSAADLPSDVQDVYFQVESQAFRSKKDFIEDIALRFALAKEKDPAVTTASIPPLNDLLELPQPSEEEMKDFYKKNEKNLPPGSTYEQIKPQLQQFLSSRSLSSEVSRKVAELEQAGRLSFSFVEPVPPVVDLPIADHPSRGGANAVATLVDVSDYLCPHCRSVKAEVDAVVEEFGDKVKVVHIDFALRPTGLSGYLARGAFCARKQSEEAYWVYHNKAFAVPLESAQNTSADAEKEFLSIAVSLAKDTAIDAKALEDCVASQESQDHINKTVQEMASKGVSGTPTFFLNNRKVMLSGKSLREVVAAAVNAAPTSSN